MDAAPHRGGLDRHGLDLISALQTQAREGIYRGKYWLFRCQCGWRGTPITRRALSRTRGQILDFQHCHSSDCASELKQVFTLLPRIEFGGLLSDDTKLSGRARINGAVAMTFSEHRLSLRRVTLPRHRQPPN